MRAILSTVLLLVVTLMLYVTIADGPDGTKAQLGRSAGAMSESIRRMSP